MLSSGLRAPSERPFRHNFWSDYQTRHQKNEARGSYACEQWDRCYSTCRENRGRNLTFEKEWLSSKISCRKGCKTIFLFWNDIKEEIRRFYLIFGFLNQVKIWGDYSFFIRIRCVPVFRKNTNRRGKDQMRLPGLSGPQILWPKNWRSLCARSVTPAAHAFWRRARAQLASWDGKYADDCRFRCVHYVIVTLSYPFCVATIWSRVAASSK